MHFHMIRGIKKVLALGCHSNLIRGHHTSNLMSYKESQQKILYFPPLRVLSCFPSTVTSD